MPYTNDDAYAEGWNDAMKDIKEMRGFRAFEQLEEEFSKLVKEISKLQEENSKFEEEISELQEEIDDFKNEKLHTDSEIEDQKEEIEKHEWVVEKVEKQEEEIEKLEKENEELKKKLNRVGEFSWSEEKQQRINDFMEKSESWSLYNEYCREYHPEDSDGYESDSDEEK